MRAEIVYIHIPKTAGKSQRSLLRDLYGEDRIFWRGQFNKISRSEALVVGGHREARHYKKMSHALYISLIRDPVERVFSHYKWMAYPGYGANRLFPKRVELTEKWLKLGLDPDSLEATIEGSEAFRRLILNTQCGYISRVDRSFEGVKATLRRDNWIIGTTENSEAFHNHLIDVLGKPLNDIRQINKPNSTFTSKNSLLTSAAKEQIRALVVEDSKLCRYLQEDWNGLYSHIERADHLPTILPNGHGRSYFLGSRWPTLNNPFREWRGLRVCIEGNPQRPEPNQLSPIRIKIQNKTRRDFNPREYDNLQVMFHLYDADGKKLRWNVCPTLLTYKIPAKSSIELTLPLWHIEKISRQSHGIAVDLRAQDRYLLSRARLRLPQPVPLAAPIAEEQPA